MIDYIANEYHFVTRVTTFPMPFDFIEQRMRFNKFSLPQIKKIPSERQSYAQYHLPPYSNIPSGSPGNRFTLLCSQLSISLAASLCSSQHIAESATLQPSRNGHTNIVLLLHVHFPLVLPDAQCFLFAHLYHLFVVLFVPQCRCGGKEEAASEHKGDER